MIDALIAGRIHGRPTARNGNSGKSFAVAKVRVSTRDGEAHFVNVIAFAEAPIRALLALSEGDSVALSGELTPKFGRTKTEIPDPPWTSLLMPF
jgi:hypothetical protein